MIDLVEEIETRGWAAPDPSSKKYPYGPRYWVTASATEGFNGGNPTGFSDCGGIDASTEANWRNYTFAWTDPTRADLFKKWKRAYRRTGWKSPVDIPDFRRGRGARYRFYSNESFIEFCEDYAEQRNDNLGWDLGGQTTSGGSRADLGRMDGQITFKKNPIIWIPELDDDTTNPCFGLDHTQFYPVILEGDYLRRSGMQRSPWQHNVFVNFLDLSYNFLCVNRKSQMRFYQV